MMEYKRTRDTIARPLIFQPPAHHVMPQPAKLACTPYPQHMLFHLFGMLVHQTDTTVSLTSIRTWLNCQMSPHQRFLPHPSSSPVLLNSACSSLLCLYMCTHKPHVTALYIGFSSVFLLQQEGNPNLAAFLPSLYPLPSHVQMPRPALATARESNNICPMNE